MNTITHEQIKTCADTRPPCDYIFFADDRSGIPTSTMHIADVLVRTNRVFWVNIYTRLPKFTGKEWVKAFRILTGRKPKKAEQMKSADEHHIPAGTPLQFPVFMFPFRQLNGFFARRFFRQFVKQHNIKNPVLLTNFPCVADAFKSIRKDFPQAKQIYYCFDDFLEYPGFNPQHWKAMEDEFFTAVDGAIFTSRDLVQKKTTPKPVLYLPHGVDYEHFTSLRPSSESTDKKPAIGFFGTIDTWVDISIITYLAKRFPQCNFSVIGRSVVPTDIFTGIRNINFIGQVPYAELPKYAAEFDVGLIPFVINDLTLAVNPLKLMEYYAVGMPVISTPLPDIQDAAGPLYFAITHEEFGNQLDKILQADLPKLKAEAKEVAKQNSWAARADTLQSFVNNLQCQ